MKEKDIFNSVVNSPVEKVSTTLLDKYSISLSVKREDKLHPTISGNKWRKLKYNLKQAQIEGYDTIITFGGAFSNHIYATAAACRAANIPCIGIIRGEYDRQNPTLIFAKKCGMQLLFVNRSDYREKENSQVIKDLLAQHPNHKLIPEGGSNKLAEKGISELAHEINTLDHDIILVSAGTGATARGILENLSFEKELWVFSSLKSDYLKAEILDSVDASKNHQLKFINAYHFGGYGKSPQQLIEFINDFAKQTFIPVDPIYNGKLIAGFSDMIHNNQIDNNKTYLWIHTGGLQGIHAYNYMASKKNKPLIDSDY